MEAAKKFTVDQGNSRGNAISNEEIDQVVKDLVNWINANIPNAPLAPPHTGGLPENLPYGLTRLLQTHDGGIQLQETFKTLSWGEIQEAIEVGKVGIHWKAMYVPFARNNEGEYLAVEGDGQVLHWSLDTGVIEQVGDSLGLYLEKFRNGLLSRKLEYLDEDCGIIEGV